MQARTRYGSVHRRAAYGRLRKKTREHEFIDRLEREFEFSPRESRGVLDVVTEMFFDNREIGAGQMEYTCVSAGEGPGKSMEELAKVRVKLTRDLVSDTDCEARLGASARRRVQILRLTEEAFDQGGLLTQEDLGRIIGVSARTIRRDVEDLMRQKLRLYLRGLQKDIGKGISHKVQVVSLYLRWKTYSEIERLTGHTVGSIKVYLNDFCRVMMARERGIRSAREIGYYLGRTERLVMEYLALLQDAEKIPEQRSRLESLKYQLRHLERRSPGKRGLSTMVWRALPC
jgi:hypothetical protein